MYLLFLLVLVGLWCNTIHAQKLDRTFWLGYTLPPYSDSKPQRLGKLAIKEFDNGTTEGVISKWSPPPRAVNKPVRIGRLAGEPGVSAFAGGSIHVDSKLLVSEKGLTINVHLDRDRREAWAISVSATSEKASVSNPGSKATKLATDSMGVKSHPHVNILAEARPPVPFVNKPVVLSSEGKVQEAPPEKTLFQKYWWVLLAVTFLAMSGGGGGEGSK